MENNSEGTPKPQIQLSKSPIPENDEIPNEQVINRLKERFNISVEEKINSGAQGGIYSITNNDNYVVKFLKNENDAVSNGVRDRVSVIGGGITKPLDSFELEGGRIIEVYKRREKDCSKLNFSESKNNQSIISIMAQIFSTVETLCDNGVILNDIKLDNMLIKDGKVTISDLGSTITVEEAEIGAQDVENEKYLSPDFIKTEKNPVYSLGAVMFEIFMDGKDFNNFLEKKCGLDGSDLYGSLAFSTEEVIADNITPDIINLKKSFSNVNFEKKEKGKEKIEEEVKKKFCELFKGMLMIDPEQRASITESKKKLINTIEYLADEVGLDIEKDLKLNDKILFNLEMFDRMKDKDKYVEDEKNEILNNIEMFLGKKAENKKEKEHMATIFGIEKFDDNGEIIPKEVNLSRGAEECLKNLRAFVSNDKKNDIKLEENIKYLKEINEKEYLLLNKLFNDSKIIKGLSKEISNKMTKSIPNNTLRNKKPSQNTPSNKEFKTFRGRVSKSNSSPNIFIPVS